MIGWSSRQISKCCRTLVASKLWKWCQSTMPDFPMDSLSALLCTYGWCIYSERWSLQQSCNIVIPSHHYNPECVRRSHTACYMCYHVVYYHRDWMKLLITISLTALATIHPCTSWWSLQLPLAQSWAHRPWKTDRMTCWCSGHPLEERGNIYSQLLKHIKFS